MASEVSAKAVYNYLSETTSTFKGLLKCEEPEAFANALFESLKAVPNLETALFFEDLLKAETQNNRFVDAMYKELRNSYLSLLFLLQADSLPSSRSKGDTSTKLILKSEQALANKNKAVERIKQKFDYFHLCLVFKDYFVFRKPEQLEHATYDADKIRKIVRFFVGADAEGAFSKLQSHMRRKLAEIESSGVLNDNFIYYQNNVGK